MGKCGSYAALVAGLLIMAGAGYCSGDTELSQGSASSSTMDNAVAELSAKVQLNVSALERRGKELQKPAEQKKQKEYWAMIKLFPPVPEEYSLVQNETETGESGGTKLVEISEEGSSELTQDQLTDMAQKIEGKIKEYSSVNVNVAIHRAYDDKLSQADIEKIVKIIEKGMHSIK
ncbi:MAG: hypothetical protein LBP31_01030 [Holosporales bacterium]|nr:hypothetical protein [Holosporales bacterium]